MELSGEEKKIQALFHELKSEDDRIAPSFARTWNIAQSRLDRSESVFPKSLLSLPALLTAAALIGVLGAAIVLWSVNLRPAQQAQTNTSEQVRNNPDHVFKPTAEVKNADLNSEKPKTKAKSHSSRSRTSAYKRTVTRAGLRKIRWNELSRWQSPTTELLRFPGDELLRTGPAVIQSAPELRTFLSHLN